MSASPVTRLNDDQCWALLERERFGRLATTALGVIDITPLNYIAWDRTILLRTAPGAKLLELTVNPDIAFEIDARGSGFAWSVVLKGQARMLTNPVEIADAERVGLRNQLATDKPIWIRIHPTQVSGRHFKLTEQPTPPPAAPPQPHHPQAYHEPQSHSQSHPQSSYPSQAHPGAERVYTI